MGVASPSNLTSWGLEVVFDSRKGNHKSFYPLEDKYRFPSLYCHALVPDFHLMIQFRVTKYNKRAGETKPTSSLEHVRSHFMFTTFNHATITVVDLMLNKINSSWKREFPERGINTVHYYHTFMNCENQQGCYVMQRFGLIKRGVDNGWITTVKDLESWYLER